MFVHHRLLSLDFPIRPERNGCSRANTGSPNFRARCVPTYQGLRPRRIPAKLAMALSRMLPSALCQGVGVLKLGVFPRLVFLAYSEGLASHTGSESCGHVAPVNASYPALHRTNRCVRKPALPDHEERRKSA
jgi:hypothetical protein